MSSIGHMISKPRRPTQRDVLSSFRHNLAKELEARDLDMKRASTEAALGETFVRDIIRRERDPQLSYIERLARAHGFSLDRLLNLPGGEKMHEQTTVNVIGEVRAGHWRDPEESDYAMTESALPADPRYPAEAQFDLAVRGTSIDRFAREGELLRCVDVARAGIDVFDDDVVIFEKKRGQLVETTAKRIRRRGPTIELWPDSDDPRWQEPLRIDTRKPQDHEQGRIVARVLYSYHPARTRRD